MKNFKELPPIYRMIVIVILYVLGLSAMALPNDKRRLIPAERNRTIWFEKNTIYWVHLSYPDDERYHGSYNISDPDLFMLWLKDEYRDVEFDKNVKFVDGSIYILGTNNTVELRCKYVIKRMVKKYGLEQRK